MSLHDAVRTRAIHFLANVAMSRPAQRPSGRATRFVALLRTLLGRATGAIRNIHSTPAIMSRADPARWETPCAVPCADIVKLGRIARGIRGTVFSVGAEPSAAADGIAAAELERRLLEIGFVEGAAVEILHEGFIRRDPIAVRLDDMRVALRRRDADAILLRVGGTSAPVVDAGG
jgi:ferrous iron transport protein A